MSRNVAKPRNKCLCRSLTVARDEVVRVVEFMAAAGATSDRVRMDKAERHPEQMKRLMEVQAARAKATAEIREREATLIQYFKDTYGIDPTESSFFNYSGGESGNQPDAPAGA